MPGASAGLMPESPILVVGFGNVLLEDEGVGVYAVEELERRYALPANVEVVDGGTSSIDLYEKLASRERVIVADAVVTGAAPGTLVCIRDGDVPALFRSRLSPHQLSLSDTLAMLKIAGDSPRHVSVIGMVPLSLNLRIGLSDMARSKLGAMVEMIADELRCAGVDPVPRTKGSEGYWSLAACESGAG